MGDRPPCSARPGGTGAGDGPRSLPPRRHPGGRGAAARHPGAALVYTIPEKILTTLAPRLLAAGLSAGEVDAKASLFARAFSALGPKASQARMYWIPGRIEFLGKHTDYAGGPSLVCAVERGFAVATLPRVDRRLHIYDACGGVTAEAELTPELVVRQDHWSNYPLTVCRRIARNFSGALHGVDLAFASDLPPAAGLSSSSALIVATFLALGEVNDLPARAEYRSAIRDTEDLAGYLSAVENGSD